MYNIPPHTSFYIYDPIIWKKAKMLADAQGVTKTKLLWNALVVYLEDKCPLDKLDAYLGNPTQKMIRIDPIIDKTKSQISEKIKLLDNTDISKQQNWCVLYMKCLNEERLRRLV